MIIGRRGVLLGLLGVAAPAIIPVRSLMQLPRRPWWQPNQLYTDLYKDGVLVHRLRAQAWPATATAMGAELVAISDPSYIGVEFDEVHLTRGGHDMVGLTREELLYTQPFRQTLTYGDSLRLVVRLG